MYHVLESKMKGMIVWGSGKLRRFNRLLWAENFRPKEEKVVKSRRRKIEK